MNDEFYIGYNSHAPTTLARFVRRVVVGIACVSVALCGVVIVSQSRNLSKTFEYGDVKPWTGTIVAAPYPALIATDGIPWLLVSPGKHGFDPSDSVGHSVRIMGTRIQYGSNRMLEVAAPPEVLATAGSMNGSSNQEIGPATLTGEIVDTKCHFGVMQPGQGKVHRACAARCLAGGIPPGLLIREADGTSRVVLLADSVGSKLDASALTHYVGEPVTISGTLFRTPPGSVLRIRSIKEN